MAIPDIAPKQNTINEPSRNLPSQPLCAASPLPCAASPLPSASSSVPSCVHYT